MNQRCRACGKGHLPGVPPPYIVLEGRSAGIPRRPGTAFRFRQAALRQAR